MRLHCRTVHGFFSQGLILINFLTYRKRKERCKMYTQKICKINIFNNFKKIYNLMFLEIEVRNLV